MLLTQKKKMDTGESNHRTNTSNYLGGQDKKRGVKHQKDKTRYKPKSVKDARYVPRKQRPNLGSNWDRYEVEDETEHSLSSSTDFSILANAPITQGQHFQFKQDKIIAEEIEKRPHGLFSLDLNMLTQSILTVPFYTRVGIEEKYFTNNQISFMNKNAEDSLARYNKKYICSNKSVNEHADKHCINDEIDSIEQMKIDDITTNENEVSHELLESVINTEQENCRVKQKSTNCDDDLEQWLDDILDQ